MRTAPMWMNVLCERTVMVTDYLEEPICWTVGSVSGPHARLAKRLYRGL